MTNNKNITIITAIMLKKNLIKKITKIKNKKEIPTTRNQMLLTLKGMIKIKSKKKMNKMLIHNKMNHPTRRMVSKMLLVL
jgi:hypothetical protein